METDGKLNSGIRNPQLEDWLVGRQILADYFRVFVFDADGYRQKIKNAYHPPVKSEFSSIRAKYSKK